MVLSVYENLLLAALTKNSLTQATAAGSASVLLVASGRSDECIKERSTDVALAFQAARGVIPALTLCCADLLYCRGC